MEVNVGGMSPRDMELGLAQAVGQFILSESAVSELAGG